MHDLDITWPDGHARFAPEDSPVALGRSPEADVILTDPSISRRHLEFVWVESSWVAKDESTHGSFDPIGVRLAPNWTLGTDTTIRLGGVEGTEVRIELVTNRPEPASAPAPAPQAAPPEAPPAPPGLSDDQAGVPLRPRLEPPKSPAASVSPADLIVPSVAPPAGDLGALHLRRRPAPIDPRRSPTGPGPDAGRPLARRGPGPGRGARSGRGASGRGPAAPAPHRPRPVGPTRPARTARPAPVGLRRPPSPAPRGASWGSGTSGAPRGAVGPPRGTKVRPLRPPRGRRRPRCSTNPSPPPGRPPPAWANRHHRQPRSTSTRPPPWSHPTPAIDRLHRWAQPEPRSITVRAAHPPGPTPASSTHWHRQPASTVGSLDPSSLGSAASDTFVGEATIQISVDDQDYVFLPGTEITVGS